MIVLTDEGKQKLMQKRFTNREIEVIEQSLNLTHNQEIADKLFVVQKTVKFHWTSIYKKLAIELGEPGKGKRHALWTWLMQNGCIGNTREVLVYTNAPPDALVPGRR